LNRNGRRQFLLAAAALASTRLAFGQAERVRRIGYLALSPLPMQEIWVSSLKDLGWIEGKNVLIDRAFAAGNPDGLPALAADLIRKRVDVIFAQGPDATVAAALATKTIPIVFWGPAFPVEQGLVDSLARPGRNLTGTAWSSPYEKQLEFVKQIAPRAKRVAHFLIPTALRTLKGESFEGVTSQVEATGKKMGLEMKSIRVVDQDAFAGAFKEIKAWGAQALITYATPLTVLAGRRIVDFANSNRLPSFFDWRGFTEAGGLYSYGPLSSEMTKQSVRQLDRILRGAQPADLPVEMPSRYEIVVNLKTAASLGIKIPQSLLSRADEVIR
jgi:putative ABC transport system substrate-binding protein